MSKMKKVISLVLCVAMLAGTFTFLGDLIAPAASAATGTTNVAKYADLDAQYDKFVYVGIDVIEVTNGELTDGYVNAGDWLEYHMTVLSDMYVSTSYPHIVYDKNFFDVRVVTSMNKPDHDNYTNTDYEGNLKFVDGTLMNPDHPYAAPNVATYHTLTALPATKIETQMGFCEIDAATYSNWDIVKSNVGITTTSWNNNFPMTEDTWWTMWYVRVKDGLADGIKGQSFSPEAIWKNQINPSTGKGDTRRLADVFTGDTKGVASKSVTISSRYNIVTLLLDDTYHTFTIGTNPADVEAPVEKKTVIFQKVDGTEIAKADYAKDETVTVPAVDGLVAWTDSTGKAVELGESFVMGEKALTYTAVLDTDEFDVKINLNGGAFAELPEGAVQNADGSVTIKAGFGETIDFSNLPLPEKEGYSAEWNPATVTVDSTRGANVTVKWNIEKYMATFYLDKAAYESATSLREIEFTYGNKVPFAAVNSSMQALNSEKKFSGWINAATGEKVNEENIFSDDMDFYADWTDFNASTTIWGLDYATGEWKAVATKNADAGAKITINDLKAVVNEENFGSAAISYAFATLTSDRAGERVSATDGYTMVEGINNIYIQTNVTFTYTFETPVFDEDGYMTEEFAKETKTVNSTSTSTIVNLAALKNVTGYKFVTWTDAEGNECPVGNVTLDFANGTEYVFTANYEEIDYTIQFTVNMDATYKQIITVDGTFNVGDTFTLSEMTYLDADGNEVDLPEIGKENKEQAAGPYDSLDGYKFAGWKAGKFASSLTDYDIAQEVTLSPAVLDMVTFNETINISGVWEALYYEFIAYYADTIDEDGNPVYKAMEAVEIQTGKDIGDALNAAEEFAKQHLPEGKRVTKLWKLADGSSVPNTMTAYGMEVYATYTGQSLSIYLDFNYGTEENPLTLDDTMILSGEYSKYLFDGVDVENDVPGDLLTSIAQTIRMSDVSSATSPGTNYEIVGWKIYHVDNSADVKDKTKWHEGINDNGTSIAKYNLIFQVQWMAHKDFLFRVYNTNGDLRSALDKKFQKHFWYMSKPVDKENAHPLNALPDRLIIIGFLPKLEFEPNFAIRVEPLTISKAWLNPANWGNLLEALFNGLSTGFGGAI